jgi:hypothetical protein
LTRWTLDWSIDEERPDADTGLPRVQRPIGITR